MKVIEMLPLQSEAFVISSKDRGQETLIVTVGCMLHSCKLFLQYTKCIRETFADRDCIRRASCYIIIRTVGVDDTELVLLLLVHRCWNVCL